MRASHNSSVVETSPPDYMSINPWEVRKPSADIERNLDTAHFNESHRQTPLPLHKITIKKSKPFASTKLSPREERRAREMQDLIITNLEANSATPRNGPILKQQMINKILERNQFFYGVSVIDHNKGLKNFIAQSLTRKFPQSIRLQDQIKNYLKVD